MLKQIDGEYYMISTTRSLYEGFLYKITRLRDYQVKANRFTKILSFPSPEEALRCLEEMSHVQAEYGITMLLDKEKMKLKIPLKFVVPLE